MQTPLRMILFGVFVALIIYLINCAIAREFKRLDLRQAVMYFCAVAMVGLYGEIFLDTVYNAAVGNPLFRYNIAPIHGGYTSSYAIVTWGIYGLHFYMLHGTLQKMSITKTWHLALIISIEALFLEAALTIGAKLYLGEFLYYYYPSDLWHVSSFQNMPFYFIFGVVIIQLLRRFQRSPRFFAVLSAWLIVIIAFMT
jgi:hypothetical protein